MFSKVAMACFLFLLAVPAAPAGIISIDDSSPAETLSLFVNLPTTSTHPGDAPPGSGSPIDIITPTPSNGISNISYNQPQETLSFKFANQIPWASDVYFYQYYTEPGTGGQRSDLFVIQGYGGQAPDYISFISDPGPLSGPVTSSVPLLPNSTATPSQIGAPIDETGAYQLAFDTGVDQYYIRSDTEVPEPASFILVSIAGAAGYWWRKRKR
jgi:hypothetical protein